MRKKHVFGSIFNLNNSEKLHPPALATDNSRAPHYQGAQRGGCCLGGGGGRHSPAHKVLGSEPLRLRTHRLCGQSRPLRSTVVEYQAPSVVV